MAFLRCHSSRTGPTPYLHRTCGPLTVDEVKPYHSYDLQITSLKLAILLRRQKYEPETDQSNFTIPVYPEKPNDTYTGPSTKEGGACRLSFTDHDLRHSCVGFPAAGIWSNKPSQHHRYRN